jgi:hypothetical protein
MIAMTRTRTALAAAFVAVGGVALVAQVGDDDPTPEPAREAVCTDYASPGGMDVVRTCYLP